VNTVGVALTNRLPDLQVGQLGAAKTKSGRTAVKDRELFSMEMIFPLLSKVSEQPTMM